MNKKTIIIVNSIILSIVFFILIWGVGGNSLSNNYLNFFQYEKNLDSNDNSKNWVNYNFGKNFLLGIEPNSIFMTEGGDNQVFSILYFALVENKRLDVDFFDQKGNVFPRLYGDILNTYPLETDLIRDIRDFQLFSTGRPAYVTWRRKDIHLLSLDYLKRRKQEILEKVPANFKAFLERKYQLDSLSSLERTSRTMVNSSVYDLKLRSGGYLHEQDFKELGPWYLKQFGLAYKVIPVRYALVEALDILGGKGNFASLKKIFSEITKINLTENQYIKYIDRLVKENYLRANLAGNVLLDSINLIKKYDSAFNSKKTVADYWQEYDFYYKGIKNSSAWDFLTLEIYSYYAKYEKEQFDNLSNFFKQKASYVENGEEKNQILVEAKNYESRADQAISENLKFNPESNVLNFLSANIYLKEQKPIEAAKKLAKINEINYKNTGVLLNAANLIFNHSVKNQDKNFIPNLELARGYLVRVIEEKQVYFKSRNLVGLEQDREVMQARQSIKTIDNVLDGARKTRSVSNSPDKTSDDLIATAGDDVNKLRQLLEGFEEKKEFTQVERIYEKILSLQGQDKSYFMEYIEFLRNNNSDKAVSVIEKTLAEETLKQEDKDDLVFFLAKLYFDKGEQRRSRGVVDDENYFSKSKKLFEMYIEINSQKQAAEVTAEEKNRLIISEKSINHIDLVNKN